MATTDDLLALVSEHAELLCSRLKELLSSGQGYVRAQLGVDLGLKPEEYPTWAVLSTTAALGLLLLLSSWAALCGGLLAGRRRGAPVTRASGEPLRAGAPLLLVNKGAKPEEQKKKNKKKPTEKKAQSNGQPVPVPQDSQEDVKVDEPVSKPPQETKIEKARVVQVQVKKNKKKTKAEGKPARSATDGKEPDDGSWETKVSLREKKQQRRKDKGPDESGSPGGPEAPKYHTETPVAPANARKNREPLHSRAAGKADAGGDAPASSGWREEPSVNGGSWAEASLKLPGQMAPLEDKWSMSIAPHRRAQPEPQSWEQETPATWIGLDGRMTSERSPAPFSMLGLKPTEPMSHPIDLQWDSYPAADDEWSGCSGMAAVDSSSDWNAPVEHWGNYEEPPVLVTPASPPKDQPGPHKVLDDEKESEDLAGRGAKSKKKKKKKRAEEEGAAAAAQVISAELSAAASTALSSQSKKSEQTSEPPKPSQKKKVRRETASQMERISTFN